MVNNKIKQLRLSKNLSQEQLAEKAKVSVRTIQRMEATLKPIYYSFLTMDCLVVNISELTLYLNLLIVATSSAH